MTIESALSEEDEYLRIQKLSEAIKEITQEMPYMKSFNQVSTLKHLLCAYPFNPVSVELVITSLIDHFQDEQFIYTFFSALMELALIQEVVTSNKGRRKSKLFDSSPRRCVSYLSPGNRYCKVVYENILEAKWFSCNYLKQLFEQAIQYHQDIQYFSMIFKLFIKNSSSIEFIHHVIQKYEECKIELFGNHKWIDDLDDEIIEYLEINQIPMPFSGQSNKNNGQIKLSPITNFGSIQNSPNSLNNSLSIDEVNEMQQELESIYVNMQKWLCISGTPNIKSRIEYLTDENHLEYLMSFIFNPTKHELIKDWEDQFKKTIVENEQNNYKIGCQFPTKCETIRSYKTTLIFLTDDNFQVMIQTIPKLIPIILYQIKISLEDKHKCVNLLHIACILDKFMQKFPKSSILIIAEMNLFSILGQFIYNNRIATIFGDILDIQVDRYHLGLHFQEQLWKYLSKIEWFTSLINILTENIIQFNQLESNENLKQTQGFRSLVQNEKEKIIPIIDFDDKKLLTDLLGTLQAGKTQEEYYNTNQLNWQLNQNQRENLTSAEIELQDIDGFKRFVKERDSYQQRSLHRIKTQNLTRSIKPTPKISRQPTEFIKFSHMNKPILQRFNSHRKQCQSIDFECVDKVLESNRSNDFSERLANSNPHSLKGSFIQNVQKTLEEEGAQSPRKINIYPSFKLNLFTGNFEKSQQKFTINKFYSQEIIQLLKFQYAALFNHLDYQHTSKLKVEHYKIDLKIILNCLLNNETIICLFKYYLFGIPSQNSMELEHSLECGIIINKIFKYVQQYQELIEIKPILQDTYLKIGEYLCKLIVKVYQIQDSLVGLNIKQTLLLLTFKQGYTLFNKIQHQQEEYGGIYKYFHSTVIHILMYWFFQSFNNNVYQNVFLKFMINVFANAPAVILSSILFRLGLVGLLYDAFNFYCLNGSEHAIQVDSLFTHIKCIVYSINAAITFRQLFALQQNLKCLDSWKKLIEINPKMDLIICQEINFMINPNFNFKHNKINVYATQISIEQTSLQVTPKLSKFRDAQKISIKNNYKVPNRLPKLIHIEEKQKILSKTFSSNHKQ